MLIKTLKERFVDYARDDNIYNAMRFIDMEYWLSDKDFGNDEVSKLSNHFAETSEVCRL